jgi:hypothetical protein
MSAGNRSAIGTLVERTTRRLVLVHLGHDKSAAALRAALIDVFAAMPAVMRKTLTWDQGTEVAMHLDLARATGVDVYFWHWPQACRSAAAVPAGGVRRVAGPDRARGDRRDRDRGAERRFGAPRGLRCGPAGGSFRAVVRVGTLGEAGYCR